MITTAVAAVGQPAAGRSKPLEPGARQTTGDQAAFRVAGGHPRSTTATAESAGKPDPSARDAAASKFDAMTMQVLVKAMLPQKCEAVFGKGMAGDVWKSMLAERLGASMAATGKLELVRRTAPAVAEVQGQVPGRASAPIEDGSGVADRGASARMCAPSVSDRSGG